MKRIAFLKIFAIFGVLLSFNAYSASLGITQTITADYNNGNGLAYGVVVQKYYNSNYTFYLTITSFQPLKKIYVFNYSCIGCSHFNEFVVELNKTLASYSLGGLNVTTDLSKVSNSIIVVPTGRLPMFLVRKGLEPSSYPDLFSVLSKNNTILYIGSDFDNGVFKGNMVKIDPSEIKYYKLNYSKYFIPSKIFNVSGTFSLNPQTAGMYDIISYRKMLNKSKASYFVVFPAQLDSWQSPKTAAKDIAKAILLAPWYQLDAVSYSSQASVQSGTEYLFSFKDADEYGLRSRKAYGFLNVFVPEKNVSERYYLEFQPGKQILFSFPSKNLIFSTATYTYTVPPRLGQLSPFIQVIDRYGREVAKVRLGTISNLDINTTFSGFLPMNFKPGYYLVNIINIDGVIYGSSVFSIMPFSVSVYGVNWLKNTFLLQFSSNGTPISTYQCPICRVSSITLVRNNQPINIYRQYNLTINTEGILNYTLPSGAILEAGDYLIQVEMFNTFYYLQLTKPEGYKLPNEVVMVLISASISFLLIYITRRPEAVTYGIDIPDFIPKEKEKIKVKKEEFLGLFEKLNRRYRWSKMPITISELKNICSQEFKYGGSQINISEINLKLVLSQLEKEGKVINVGSYYLPSDWVKEGYDAKYLTMFRILRSFFTSKAIPFTDLGQSQESDMEVIFNGEKYYITLVSNPESLKSIKLLEGHKQILMFYSEQDLEAFKNEIFNSSSREAAQIRLAIFSNKLILLTADYHSLSSFFVT